MPSGNFSSGTAPMATTSFPGRFANLEPIGNWIGKAAEQAGLDGSAVYAVQLAVDEACTNIIEHAYGGEDKGNIDLSTDVTESAFTIILRDHGKPFNPDLIPMPKTNLPLDEIQPRGLGLYLMRRMMDEVQFQFSSDQGNILRMVKHK
jgi:serine/threonine-protein kinase RsbW